MRTIDQIQADLSIVYHAIAEVCAGRRIFKFTLGSAESNRQYEYSSPTLAELENIKLSLLQELNMAQGDTVAPVFRKAFYQTSYDKFGL